MSIPEYLVVTRVFQASPEQIWSAFTDPEQLHRFFGPEGTHVPLEEVSIDVRVGGEFSLTMHSDENDDVYPMQAEYVIVDEPVKFQLLTSNGGEITIEIRDLGMDGKTLLTWTTRGEFPSESFYSGTVIGTHSAVDQLGELLTGAGVQR